jgi:hypothetical protein
MTPQVTDQVTPQVARVLGPVSSDCSFADLLAAAGLKGRVHFLKTHLDRFCLQAGLSAPSRTNRAAASRSTG